MDFTWETLARLLAACVAGAVVGLERELHDKPAGLRTNIMICLGAAVFTLISIRMAGSGTGYDPARVAAQIVTGVGFLGAGAIIHLRSQVIGLTTAATIWLVASVGMALGAGAFVLGAVATALTTAVLFGLTLVEGRIALWRSTAHFQIGMDPAVPADELSRLIAARVRELHLARKSCHVNKTANGLVAILQVNGPEPRLEKLQESLLAEPGVKSLQRL